VRHDHARNLRIVVDSSLGTGGGPLPLGRLRAWPNPARANTQVSFTLPQAASVELDVTDVTGRHVRTLAHGSLPAGSHFAEWDGREAGGRVAPAGVYLVTLRRGTQIRTTRVVRTP